MPKCKNFGSFRNDLERLRECAWKYLRLKCEKKDCGRYGQAVYFQNALLSSFCTQTDKSKGYKRPSNDEGNCASRKLLTME